MVVQHNLTAINANRMLGITQGTLSSSTEKLSSGYKINRAADDAAGLSISEKMRKQIRGLTKASSNAEDGISAVQTAEGALQEVTDMLQRMNELAVQASNGTNSTTDRQSIQDEIEQLTTEIDRVAETTKFNETYLLKGNADGTSSSQLVNAHDAGLAGKLVDNGKTAKFTVDSKLNEGDKVTIAGAEYTIGTDGAGKSGTDGYKKLAADNTAVKAGDSITDKSKSITYTIVDKAGISDVDANAGGALKLTSGKSAFTVTHEDGSKVTYDVDDAGGAGKISAKDAEDLIKQELAAGSKVTMTKDAIGNGCNIEVVNALTTTGANQEISSYNTSLITQAGVKQSTVDNLAKAANFTNGVTDMAEGDSVTISGKTTTYLKSDPAAASDISDIISKLDDGAKVSISRDAGNGTKNAVTYTVGKTTDAVNNVYTVADLADLIKHGDDVAIATSATDYDAINEAAAKGITIATDGTTLTNLYTTVGNVKSEDSDVISKADALQKIADELQKASSIGTDTAATVVNNNDGTFEINKGSVEVKDKLNFSLHVGADADMTNKITVNLESMSAAGLGIKGINVNDETGMSATYAVDSIEDAIKKVSSQRSALGAVQNRLEHTIKNLDNVVENTTAAESQIRDTDMATEMVKYSNSNILAQAGQSMLAQANQSNQGVLSLLG
ncbi:MAG: flagellin [Lachnospiraceae bacterium]|nr:MAG: hypothetical protein BHV95_00270 [Clostridiales bacterium Nov_37_41]